MKIVFACIFIIFVFCLFSWKILSFMIRFMEQHQLTDVNYRGQRVPHSLGAYIWTVLILYYLLIRLINRLILLDADILQHVDHYVIALSVVFFVGWLDDTAGDKKVKGLIGHWIEFFHHQRLTTGLLKAMVTGGIALWLVWELQFPPWESLVLFMNLLLTTNLLNLLDLRPGRALKAGFVILLLFVTTAMFINLWILIPIWVSMLILFPFDLKGSIMLGDSGANMIGFALGYYLMMSAGIWFQVAWLVILFALQWCAERYSFSLVIEQVGLLRWLDQLGRKL